MNRIGWVAMLAAALCAPAWGKGFKERDTLAPDEGILAAAMTCGRPIAGVQVFRAGKPSGGFWAPLKADGSLGCGGKVQLLRVKAGQYYIGQLHSGTNNLAVPEDKSPHFTVEAGRLNYVGDVYAGSLSLHEVGEDTLMRIAGRMLTVLNHEPQARQRIEQEYASVLARYPFVADAGLPAAVPKGEPPELEPGRMHGLMTISSAHWKLGEDGQPLVCTRSTSPPEGTQRAPGEDAPCEGEYVTPQAYVAVSHPDATVHRAQPREGEGDDGPLIITYTGP
ncbi:hypothetical protein [Luteimonas suaedae]|uniref:hypothetical protein n=1 Tax=Luteimonas suaedae TaxID=2605430 RepID=UPI0011ED4077|nr:hypothetical protein [Luteimonas suaedae]